VNDYRKRLLLFATACAQLGIAAACLWAGIVHGHLDLLLVGAILGVGNTWLAVADYRWLTREQPS
jgi:hypothetical protein